MTQNDAYVAGFCKAAEAAGVDPEVLYKRAQALKAYSVLGSLLSRFRVGAKGAGARYVELLKGGRPRFVDQVRASSNIPRWGSSLEVTNPAKRTANRLRMALKDRIARLRGGSTENPADVLEARKALATQVGTGAAGLGALMGVGSAVRGKDNGNA